MRPAALLTAFVLALPLAARAEDEAQVQVQVSVDRPRPGVDQVVRLTYTFSGSGSLSQVRPPAGIPLKNLQLVGGPATGTQISFINGDLKKSVSFTYYLRPMKEGQGEIGETSWTVGAKQAKAAAYIVEVGPARGGPQEEPGDPMGFPSPFRDRSIATNPQRRDTRQMIVEYIVTPDRTTAYLGEEIVLHYELLTQVDIQGLEVVEPPKFPGCWSEDLEKPERPTGVNGEYLDQKVVRFTLLKKAVSGLNAGTITIPPAKIRLAVRGAGDPFFDPFGLGERRIVERETKPLTLTILPIPGNPKFTGPVGKFDLTAKVDRTKVQVGEAVTLKVRLAGTGNLRTATEAPTLSVPDARLYPPTTRSETSRTAKSGVFTEWSYVVVPAKGGPLTIPPVSLTVFSPQEKRLVTKTTPPLVLDVEGKVAEAAPAMAAATATSSSAPAGSGSAETLTSADLKTPAAPAKALTKSEPAPTLDLGKQTVTLPLWVLAAVPGALVVLGVAALAVSRRRRVTGDFASALRPEPGETKERAAARIDRALRDWVTARFGLPEGASAAILVETLHTNGLESGLVGEVRVLLDELDFLRYAPQLGDYSSKIHEARDRAARVFRRLK